MNPNEQPVALVAAFNRDSELLLLKRPEGAHCGGLWSLPGGRMEPAERPLAAAVRELKEETRLTGRNWRHVGKSIHSYPDRTLFFILFACIIDDAEALHAESEHAWVPLADLSDYPMPEANDGIVGKLEKTGFFESGIDVLA